MISIKSTVNVQSVSENNQLTISNVFNQIKCGRYKLKPEVFQIDQKLIE